MGPRIMTRMAAMGLPPSRSSRGRTKKARRESSMMAWASTAHRLEMRMSRCFTWPISWASTASSWGRDKVSRMPSVTATTAWSGSRPVANALGVSSGMTATLGMGSPARWARLATTAYSSGAWSGVTSCAR